MSVAYKDQLYAELKKQHNQNGTLFEDPEFPATDSSIYYKDLPDEIRFVENTGLECTSVI
uniref:Uncharacterized protein n=1 Tax=Poecilia mexicana TaxID=48701 RepID=A0A3B3X8T9_9TELE